MYSYSKLHLDNLLLILLLYNKFMALDKIKIVSENAENEDIIKKEKKGKEGEMEAQTQNQTVKTKREIIDKVYDEFFPQYKENGLGIPEEEFDALQEKIDSLSEEELFAFRDHYDKFALSGSYTGNIVIKNGRKIMEMDAEEDAPRLLYFLETVFGKDNRRMIENGIILKKALNTRIHPKTKISVINNLRRLYSDSKKLKDNKDVAKARAVVRGFLFKLCNEKVKNEMVADEMAEFFQDIELSFLLPQSLEAQKKIDKEIDDKIEEEWQNFKSKGIQNALQESIFKLSVLKRVKDARCKEYLTQNEKETLTFEEQQEKIKAAKLAEIDAIYKEFEKASGSKEKCELSAGQKHILNAESLKDKVAMEVSGKTFDALQLRAAKSFENKLIQEAMNYDAAEDYLNRVWARFNNQIKDDDSINNTEKEKIIMPPKKGEELKKKKKGFLEIASDELDKKGNADKEMIIRSVKKAERIIKKLLDKKSGVKPKKLNHNNVERIKQLIKAEEEDYEARNLPDGDLKKFDFLNAHKEKFFSAEISAFKKDPYKFIDDYYTHEYNKNQKKEEK